MARNAPLTWPQAKARRRSDGLLGLAISDMGFQNRASDKPTKEDDRFARTTRRIARPAGRGASDTTTFGACAAIRTARGSALHGPVVGRGCVYARGLPRARWISVRTTQSFPCSVLLVPGDCRGLVRPAAAPMDYFGERRSVGREPRTDRAALLSFQPAAEPGPGHARDVVERL